MKPACFAVMLTVALCGVASASPPLAQPPLQAGDSSRTVVVRRGETAIRIARAHGVTVAQLCAANGLANPDRVFAGQRLLLPAGASAQPTSSATRAAHQAVSSPFDTLPLAPAAPVSPAVRAPRRQQRGSAPRPVSAPRRAAETVVTEVATLGALVAAPTGSTASIVRPAPLTRRNALDAARLERFGVTRSVAYSARRGAFDVVGPFRE